MTLPPLELAVEVVDANGVRYRWDPNAEDAGNRPQNISFSTKRGDGFADASVTLARRIDQEWVDLNLFDDVSFIAGDGSVAYEGRVAAMPRSFSEVHSIGVQLAGWMAHARDQSFTEIYVDRDLSSWQPTSRPRSVSLMASNFGLHTFDAGRDSTNSTPALVLKIDGNWVSPYLPIVEPVYDAGVGNKIGAIYAWTQGATGVAGNANFNFAFVGGPTDAAFDVTTGDLWSGADTANYYSITPRRFIGAPFQYTATPAGAAGISFILSVRNLALYGDHGLTVYGNDPKGVYGSDVIKDICKRFCPKLNTNGVEDATWPIPHLVFKEMTDPYDAFTLINAYHLWELGVWEGKTLTFAPTDRSDYDWEIRENDPGVTVEHHGDTTDDLYSSITVDFTNVATGAKDTLLPDDYTDLVDSNPNNPATRHGIARMAKLSLSIPTTTDAALQIGRAALAELQQPKAPGTITFVGHVKDRAGHWQQGWKVRAGDTIAITDHPNDAPRLVTETSWNHDSKQMSVTVDSPAKRIDALLDRIGVALTAAGLT